MFSIVRLTLSSQLRIFHIIEAEFSPFISSICGEWGCGESVEHKKLGTKEGKGLSY